MLNAPHSVSQQDMAAMDELKKRYPYFVPAHYVQAADKNSRKAFDPAMMSNMQLYMGNWLLFCQYLQSSQQYAQDAKPADNERVEIIDTIIEIEEPVTELPEPEHDFFSENIFVEKDLAEIEEKIVREELKEELAEEARLENFSSEDVNFDQDNITTDTGDRLILPIYTEDYFLHQGIEVSNEIPDDMQEAAATGEEDDRSLMVMMSFSEWLLHFKTRTQKEREEREDQKALKTMWQKEKLAAALEEENEEIPENVFEMAVNSITREEGLVSEALADVYEKQGKHDKAIDMYRKLSLRNPQKNAYFARKIEKILKESES